MTASSTEPLTHPSPVSGLRLLPAPASAPPYDDEAPTGGPGLRLVPPLPPEAQVLRSEPPAQDPWAVATRTPAEVLPGSRAFAHALVQVVLEVLAGVRPLRQLQRDTTPELYARLQAGLPVGPRSCGPRPDGRSVRSLHVQERPEGVAEVCATVDRGGRAVALALRLEGLDGRWRCTDLAGV